MARSIFETCWGKKNPQDETHLPHNCRLRNLPKVKHITSLFAIYLINADQCTNPLCWVNGKVAVQTPATGLRPITPGWNSHMSDRFMTGYDQTLPTCNGWKRSYESESRRLWNCGVLSHAVMLSVPVEFPVTWMNKQESSTKFLSHLSHIEPPNIFSENGRLCTYAPHTLWLQQAAAMARRHQAVCGHWGLWKMKLTSIAHRIPFVSRSFCVFVCIEGSYRW